MIMRRTFTVLEVSFTIAILVLTAGYLYVVKEKLEAAAFLKALSEVRTGVTTREEYENKMRKFHITESAGATACYEDGCLSGVGFGFDNSVLGRIHLFPETVLAVGVYFDSSNIVKASSVTLDRHGVAIVTLDQEPPKTGEAIGGAAAGPMVHVREGLIHKILDNSKPEELNDLAVSCFTSWYGCDTPEDLLSKHR
jgi:hypothetical protein